MPIPTLGVGTTEFDLALAQLRDELDRHRRRLSGEPVVIPRVRLLMSQDPHDPWEARLELVDDTDSMRWCTAADLWDRNERAIEVAREYERLGIYWLEEPFEPDEYEAYAELADTVDIWITAGEQDATWWGFRELIDRDAPTRCWVRRAPVNWLPLNDEHAPDADHPWAVGHPLLCAVRLAADPARGREIVEDWGIVPGSTP